MPLNMSTMDDNEMRRKGVLYVVATPIGNLDDITLRAIKTFESVDFIIAEDTRHTGRLLSHFEITCPLVSCHEHNERQKAGNILFQLNEGKSAAIVSDAGTPSVSDPGYYLVKRAIEQGIKVVPIPGVSAAVAALSVSGFATDMFIFMGFPHRKKGKRKEQIQSIESESRTVIFYESPRRVLNFLNELKHLLGERECVVGREMTKFHEEFIRGNFTFAISELEKKASIKGEFTILLSGAEREEISIEDIQNEIKSNLKKQDIKHSALAKKISKELNVPRNVVYNEILKIINA